MKKTKGDNPLPSKEPAYDWSQSQVTGFENTTSEDLGIPFLVILQKGSPEVDPDHADHETKVIAGATSGCIINTLTREILHEREGDPLRVIPCGYHRMYVEWKKRDSGGGIVRVHRNSSILEQTKRDEEKNVDVLENGNLIVTTAYFYVKYRNLEDTEWISAVISMTSTQLKKARMWLNMMMSMKINVGDKKVTPPMYSHNYYIASIPESNSKGNWLGWKIESGEILSDPELIQNCMVLSKLILAAPPKLAIQAPETDEAVDQAKGPF